MLVDGQWADKVQWMDILSPSTLFSFYTANLTWSLFLTSTAIHAVLLITSPVQAVYKWYRRQSSDSDTAIPYLCAAIGSLLWLRYSIFIHDIKLVLLQSYAVFMQTFFLFAMLFYRSKKRRLLRIIMAAFGASFCLFLLIAQLPESIGVQVSGVCASGAQIAGSFVCPYLIYKAFTTKVIDFIPFAPVAFTWVMELHAIIYSIGINDFYLLLANSIFFCMDGCLLAMFFIFPTERKGPSNENYSKPAKVNVL
ncbi:sugar efflux transporter for intercellular exchange domain-containing protein [Ditylenchus destructor]|uniref:Sugar transporter SWEET n=1 Tax=Ditylenchus destructor TaxID=166010 RepID=A0AAD4N177_9BILA|nr:sugar efflux transporter for intercellular exchange domain-containing protein [Ditylenchus destructor]